MRAVATAETSNRLGAEKSPYLLQHAHNPIWWRPWGPEALEAAKRENKPVFLSIGYSSCYWCHFMEKDSFEKQDVADVLNAHFISIKVDREERPDVDHVYMTALVSMTGAGGWPMSMFLTPEGRPFYGASTIPHDNFIPLLKEIAKTWKTDEARIRRSGEEIADHLARALNASSPPGDAGRVSASGEKAFGGFFTRLREYFDETHAGFGGGNKFPRPHLHSALLRVHRRSGEGDALRMVTRTLKAMSRGGIHDILAGGFHRYSVDAELDIPHFEKMLYDNAGIAVTSLEAWQATGDPEFAAVARKTLDWTLAEMADPAGGFYSAQDAGDFGEEGDYYAWTWDELSSILSKEEFQYAEKIFQISKYGNFEGDRNVFHVPDAAPVPDDSDPVFRSVKEKLLRARAKRKRPRLDDKVLADWNGLTIAAMARGHQALGDEKYLKAAQKAATFIRSHMTDAQGGLLHRWRDGAAAHRGLVDDYAFLIHGLIELYQSDFDPAWMDWAVGLQSMQDALFWDEKGGAYFLDDAKDPTLLVRSREFEDMAVPSGNSVAALNLLRLADFTYEQDGRSRAERILRAAAGWLDRAPDACPQMLIALDYALDRSKEIAILGGAGDSKVQEMLKTVRRAFLPNKVVAVSDGKTPAGRLLLLEGKTAGPHAYVCERGLCKNPTGDPAELLKQVSDVKPLKW